jgi:hypothetical protein
MANNSGTLLIEALVALALLEVVALFTLSAALTTRRTLTRVRDGGATDVARLAAIRAAAASPSCRSAPGPEIIPLAFPSTAHRAALQVELRCGR